MKYQVLFYLFMFSISISKSLKAQQTYKSNNYKLGLGYVLLGSGDVNSFIIVNEFSRSFTKKFEGSLNFGFGKGIPNENFSKLFSLSLFQINVNTMFIPIDFKNKLKLKFGTGVSYLNIDKVGAAFGYYDVNGNFIVEAYNIENFQTIGYNLLFENELNIYSNFTASVLLFGQFYQNNNTIAGGMVKLGYNF